jgi:hypothetical protein
MKTLIKLTLIAFLLLGTLNCKKQKIEPTYCWTCVMSWTWNSDNFNGYLPASTTINYCDMTANQINLIEKDSSYVWTDQIYKNYSIAKTMKCTRITRDSSYSVQSHNLTKF